MACQYTLYPKVLLQAAPMATVEDKNIGKRLRRARIDAGLSLDEAAQRTGSSKHTIEAHEKGKRTVSRQAAAKYGKHYGADVEWILGFARGSDQVKVPATAARGLPVVGTVMAGAFREALEMPESEQERLPVQYDAAYVQAHQFALRVQGPSMNLVYPEGTYVICISAADADPRLGDHVVCQRERNGLYEFTLKELASDPKTGKPRLLPRSSDPLYQAPVELKDGNAEIIAVVIGSYVRRQRRGPTAFAG